MRQLLRRLQYVIHRSRLENDLAEEMEFHRSMSGARAFGSAALARNQSRDVWIWPWLQDVAQDVRFAARLLTKDRRFTFAAVAALALGIAANTTVFTFINTVLFKDLPFEEPRQIVAIGTRDARGRDLPMSYADFQDVRVAARAYQSISAHSGTALIVSEKDLPPERLRGSFISANTFEMLRVTPILGRGFISSDDVPGAPPVVVIAHDVWTNRYGGDPHVIGREIRLNDVPSIVIGVMPAGFRFPLAVQAWQPLGIMPMTPVVPGLTAVRRDARTVAVTARLRPDATIEQARSELTAIAARLAQEHPDTNRDVTATVAPPLERARQNAAPILMTMLGAVGFVLLIGCANVSALMLARAASRAREIAIRSSLGATRWRIVRQLSIESLLLAMVGGVAGLLLSNWGVRFFGVFLEGREIGAFDQAILPYWVDLRMDHRVFAFVAALCLGSSFLFGLAPALHISRTNTNDVLKEHAHNSGAGVRVRRWTTALMVGELALALTLLSGAGLLVRSFLIHYSMPTVIDTHNLVIARTVLPVPKYATPQSRKAFFDRLDERLAARRGAADASVASDVPLVPLYMPSRTLAIEGRSNDKPPSISHVYVGARYFETLGLHVITGRTFTSSDGEAGHEVAIVSQRFATMHFPNEDAIGRRIRLAAASPTTPSPAPWTTIVGIVPTIPEVAMRTPDPPLVYLPMRSDPAPGRSVSVIVRSDAGLGAIRTWLRDDGRAVDPDLPWYYIQSMDPVVAQTRESLRMMGALFGLLAVIGVVLSAVGLYALTAHGVAQRVHEIGIRMALGAQTGEVVWLFMQRTLLQVVIGLILGLGGALSAGRLIESSLVRTSPRDPMTLTAISLLLVAVVMLAALVPARRAARVDPVVALRYE